MLVIEEAPESKRRTWEDGMIRVKSPQDLGAGLLFIFIGVVGVYFGKGLTFGSA